MRNARVTFCYSLIGICLLTYHSRLHANDESQTPDVEQQQTQDQIPSDYSSEPFDETMSPAPTVSEDEARLNDNDAQRNEEGTFFHPWPRYPYYPRPYYPRPYPIHPVPYYANWQCNAWGVGYEEHYGGHVVFGYDYARVYQQALYNCQYFHGTCQINCFRR